MEPVIIVENEFITLRYLPDKKIIYHTVHKPMLPVPELLKDALNKGTETLGRYGACKWLSDDRRNGPLSDELIDWGANNWNLRTIQAGWKYWANVVPEEVASAGTLAPVMDALFELGLRMAVFTNLEKAFEWLDKQE